MASGVASLNSVSSVTSAARSCRTLKVRRRLHAFPWMVAARPPAQSTAQWHTPWAHPGRAWDRAPRDETLALPQLFPSHPSVVCHPLRIVFPRAVLHQAIKLFLDMPRDLSGQHEHAHRVPPAPPPRNTLSVCKVAHGPGDGQCSLEIFITSTQSIAITLKATLSIRGIAVPSISSGEACGVAICNTSPWPAPLRLLGSGRKLGSMATRRTREA